MLVFSARQFQCSRELCCTINGTLIPTINQTSTIFMYAVLGNSLSILCKSVYMTSMVVKQRVAVVLKWFSATNSVRQATVKRQLVGKKVLTICMATIRCKGILRAKLLLPLKMWWVAFPMANSFNDMELNTSCVSAATKVRPLAAAIDIPT